ncbi:hypothetical protein MBAV_005448 [Candidatus Magnetobacterium bavaricum]|uniref:Uncharacterized protein n=1 Tax=Candidatus Magnetobacterium bavaricum TaxID=29290 RepID=A0A0F3GNW2_9BACT|nr:hypothetical protein MBAV_005448 [Candidatus Magnetobacterium bavaricum]
MEENDKDVLLLVLSDLTEAGWGICAREKSDHNGAGIYLMPLKKRHSPPLQHPYRRQDQIRYQRLRRLPTPSRMRHANYEIDVYAKTDILRKHRSDNASMLITK